MDEFIFVTATAKREKSMHTPRHIPLTISKISEELYLFYFLFPLPTKKSIYKFIIRSIFPFNSFFSLPSLLFFSHPIYRRNSRIGMARQHWIRIVRNKWNKQNKQSKRTNGKIKASELSLLVCAYTQTHSSCVTSWFILQASRGCVEYLWSII